jgi:hypothetical protein
LKLCASATSRIRYYFFFTDLEQGILRYREDEFLDEQGKIEQVRSRLTLIGPTLKTNRTGSAPFPQPLPAPATQRPRFYRNKQAPPGKD